MKNIWIKYRAMRARQRVYVTLLIVIALVGVFLTLRWVGRKAWGSRSAPAVASSQSPETTATPKPGCPCPETTPTPTPKLVVIRHRPQPTMPPVTPSHQRQPAAKASREACEHERPKNDREYIAGLWAEHRHNQPRN